MICIINYGAGNLASVQRAIHYLHYDTVVVDKGKNIPENATTIILPGVGDGAFMMEELKKRDFVSPLKQWVHNDKPLLGICVGAQVLLSFTAEGNAECLDIMSGRCEHLKGVIDNSLKIPHIGWNEIDIIQNTALFKNIPNKSSVYFVHSYFLSMEHTEHIIATTEYGESIPAIIGVKKTIGVQFHPEKSGKWGLLLFDNFLHYYGNEEKNVT